MAGEPPKLRRFSVCTTTASALNCLLLTLPQHPAELAWLQEELGSLPWPPEEGEAGVATNALRAPGLDAVVKEVMRLTPPVGGFFRRTGASDWNRAAGQAPAVARKGTDPTNRGHAQQFFTLG